MTWNNYLIGKNAGIVWRVLNHNEMSWDDLLNQTALSPLELASAIGWLARENKICMQSRGEIFFFSCFHESYF